MGTRAFVFSNGYFGNFATQVLLKLKISLCLIIQEVACLTRTKLHLMVYVFRHKACLAFFSLLCILSSGFASTGELADPTGALSITLPAGSPSVPSYVVSSSGLKGDAVFRGQVKLTNGNEITFHRVPDLLDPTKTSAPFRQGMLATQQARATAVLDGNKSLLQVNPTFPGLGYLSAPRVFVDLPTDGNDSAVNYQLALVVAEINASAGQITSLSLEDQGKGYITPPDVKIEGGVHFIRCAERESAEEGKFYLITSNTGDILTLSNPLGDDLSQVFTAESLVEIFEAWTLGSLFGYESSVLQDGNSSVADYVYLLKPPSEQDGTSNDYRPYFHDGSYWKEVDGNGSDVSETIIYPDESFMIARRGNTALDLVLSGTALTQNTFFKIPQKSKRFLMNNPFGVDMMLSDLISSENIDNNVSNGVKWLAAPSQEVADNVEILNQGVWSTYWHDGTNKDITRTARISARSGTGIAGSMSQQDLSMNSGSIANMTNPLPNSNIVVTSPEHGLREGFVARISGARGRKTNEAKDQVDEDGNPTAPELGLIITSAANGYFEVTNVTSDTFELKGKSGNCDFISEGTAVWKTGNPGTGYSSDAFVSFVGGGGHGAMGIAKVQNGSIATIILTSPGSGYVGAPKVRVHSGGWRKLGAGRAPFNDVLIPAGAGILLVRKHPSGVSSTLAIRNPIKLD